VSLVYAGHDDLTPLLCTLENGYGRRLVDVWDTKNTLWVESEVQVSQAIGDGGDHDILTPSRWTLENGQGQRLENVWQQHNEHIVTRIKRLRCVVPCILQS
jgi:hypothetical protein